MMSKILLHTSWGNGLLPNGTETILHDMQWLYSVAHCNYWPLFCPPQFFTTLISHGISVYYDDVIKWIHFSALLALCAGNSPVIGEFPSQKPVTRSFDVFFDLSLNKRLSKQSCGWWFEMPSVSFWRHCNVIPVWSNVNFIIKATLFLGNLATENTSLRCGYVCQRILP